MIPYLVLISVPFIFYFIDINKTGKNSILYISKKRISEKNSLCVLVFFILFYLLLALRDETIGRDLPNYKKFFQVYSEYNYVQLFDTWKESLFKLINWSVGKFTSNYQVYLAIIAAIIVIPIASVYCKNATHGYLKIIIFVNMSTFIMIFSGLRQSLAMAVGMVAYIFVKKKKILPFALFATVALLIHHSGFMVFLMYPIYRLRLKKKHLIFILPIMAALLYYNAQIFNFVTSILSVYSDKYGFSSASTGAFGSLVLFVVFLIFSYIISDESRLDDEGFGLRNFLIMTVAIQCFAPLNTLAMRLNYYYILFIPLAIGKCLDYPKDKYKPLADIGEVVLCVFFTVYFIYNTYISYKTGISPLDTIPYVPFWKN